MNTNDHGFRLLEERDLPETGGLGRLYEHEATGARLLHLVSNDDNKVFGIGFRTPSANSTGVAHILEHSVLNGSRKYRTKEPFMDLAKSSLNTFLNAMTFSDKTIYPVASRNAKDFANLMDVYLDAVFYPDIYQTKEIFLQEGWHHHLEHPDDPVTYRGVVYNEMRGALSGAEEQVMDEVLKGLYPDTVYGFESGGNPYDIPDLTYEAFLDFHRFHYHPSNSYIFLYGDMDIEVCLKHIHDHYLSDFEKIETRSDIAMQAPFEEAKTIETRYSVSSQDEAEGKDYFAYGVVMGTRQRAQDAYTAEILTDVLIDAQSAPLRQALLEAGIGADITGLSGDGIQIPFGVMAKECSPEDWQPFVTTIEDTLRRLVAEGIPKDQLRASLNKMEYELREASGYATKGIIYYIQAMESWLYDGSPFAALQYEEMLTFLRDAIDTDYFEQYTQSRILDNPHKIVLRAQAEAGLNDQKDAAVTEALAAFKEGLSDEARQEIIAATQRLIARQNSLDTPEARATIPKLTREDVDTAQPDTPQTVHDIAGVTVLHHPLFTAGIDYIDLTFDCDHLEPDVYSDFSLLTSLIGAMDTASHSYSSLDTIEYLHTGGVSIVPHLLRRFNDPDTHMLKLWVASKVIGQKNATVFFDYVLELLQETDLTDRKRLREVVQMLRSRIEMGMYQQGHHVVSSRVCSYFSPYHKKEERLGGLDFFFYLQDLDRNFDDRADALVTRLEELRQRLLTRHGMVVGISGSEASFAALKPALESFLDKIPEVDYEPTTHKPDLTPQNEGVQSAASVQYVAKGADFRIQGVAYNGEMEVLSNMLTHEYLYNNIRAKGGAYGQGLRLTRPGVLYVYSYRDPNLEQTLETYNGMADYLESVALDDATLLPYIIGVMNRFNPARTARAQGREAMRMYLIGKDKRDSEKAQQEALNTTPARLKAYAPMLRNSMAQEYMCVLGNSARLQQSEALFDKLIRLDNSGNE